MFSELSLIMVVLAVVLWVSSLTANRIPKRGRDGAASGERISATITNTNKFADSVTTMRAEKDGRKFRVKIKPTEARLWIKGDSIDIIMNEDGKNYRVLFGEYFRNNEERIREKAVSLLEKIKNYRIAALLVSYKDGFREIIDKSSLNSQQIFAFVTYMKLIDIYSVMAILLTGVIVWWKLALAPKFVDLMLPVALVLFTMWAVYNAAENCKRILKNAEKSNQK